MANKDPYGAGNSAHSDFALTRAKQSRRIERKCGDGDALLSVVLFLKRQSDTHLWTISCSQAV